MNAQIGSTFRGEWNFMCPDAGEGFDTGTIKIGNDSVYIEYPGMGETISSTWTKSLDETFSFRIDLNGQRVTCILKLANVNTLSGVFATKYSEFPLILVRGGRICSE